MSLVENLVNQISTKGLGGITKPQGLDLNDKTFENLLQGYLDINQTKLNNNINMLGSIGQPAGIIIEPFDGTSAIQPIGQNNMSDEPLQIKDVDMGNNYFSNLIKEAPLEHKSIMNVAKKYATAAYNTFGKTLIEDLTDFAKDVKSFV